MLKSDTKSPSDRVLFRHWFSRTKKKGMSRFETFPEFAFTSNTLLLRIDILETELKLLIVIDSPVDCPFGLEKNNRFVVSVENEK